MDVIIDRMHPLGIKTTSTYFAIQHQLFSVLNTNLLYWIHWPATEKTFAWVVWYILFKSQFQLNRDNWKYIVSFSAVFYLRRTLILFWKIYKYVIDRLNWKMKSLNSSLYEKIFINFCSNIRETITYN